MKLRDLFISSALSVALGLGACSEQKPVEQKNSEAAIKDAVPVSPAEPVVPGNQDIPFSDDLDGLCFYILTMKSASQTTTRREGFENAKKYFDDRVNKYLNVDIGSNEWLDGYSGILIQQNNKMHDKYDLLTFIPAVEDYERRCIRAAERDQAKLGAPSP